MEPSSEVALPAPVVTKSENSVTESAQEHKVEQVANGTVETSSNSEKVVSQSVQSSIQTNGDQNIVQKSVVEEVKQESFSSSSVVVEKPAAVESPVPVAEPVAPVVAQPEVQAPEPVVQPQASVPVEQPQVQAPLPVAEPVAPAAQPQIPVAQPSIAQYQVPIAQPPVAQPPVAQPQAPIVQPQFQAASCYVPPPFEMRRDEQNKEIQQENIKQQLNEIITDIEKNVQIGDDVTDNSNDERLDGKKPVDLQKIFTPATDVDEILPGKNRKLFASSSFYSPTIHPTVEQQVELAQRISHSLSDVNNHTSKGQSMYVNRKKRSVKWIHDDGREEERFVDEQIESKENGYESQKQEQVSYQNGAEIEPKKVPLKLLMDPRHVQDANSVRNQYGYEPAPMSPEFGYELVNALNAPKGKGAELFAKRRKKAEKWIVEGAAQFPGTPSAASTVPAFTEAGIQRVQNNMMMDQIQEKYQQPRVGMVRSPWDAALETGNADNAFVSYDQQQKNQPQFYSGSAGQVQNYELGSSTTSSLYSSSTKKDVQYQSSKQIKEHLTARDLAYRPTVPQGWQRPVHLPAGIYTPPEISVGSTITTSYSSEKISKFSSSTSSNFADVSLPPQSAPLSFQQASPAAAPQQQQPLQQQKPAPLYQQKPAPQPAYQKPVQQVPQQQPKPQTPVVKTPPAVSPAPVRNQMASPRSDLAANRTGFNASPVTPGILKKQIQLDAAVPVMPGSVVPSPSPATVGGGRSGAKSPMPIYNTPPAPYGFPALSIQTPETIAQQAPASTPLVPHLQNPKPLPLIVSTPLPSYSSSYNNAARPFGQVKDYYRPINMDSVHHKLVPPVVYTDF